MKQYDYIIAGGGCAGLSLLMHMMSSPILREKKILLIERDSIKSNDRTWCFWEKTDGLFEPVVYKRWHKLAFSNKQFSRQYDVDPYQYKMIRGADFYRFCLNALQQMRGLEISYASVERTGTENDKAFAVVDGNKIYSDYVFNSIPPAKPLARPKEFYLLQHFKGWVVHTRENVFNPELATLMDFRVDQSMGTAFVYVMPFSDHEALIEYTLFSESLLEATEYDEGLKKYINEQITKEGFTIKEEEFGIIPMTNHQYPVQQGRVINIGTAGGQTKASTGYTFNFIQKQSNRITSSLEKGALNVDFRGKGRFHFYDSVLLNVLATGKLEGETIFGDMFRKNKVQDILSFLDNESSLQTDLKLISSLPTWPFLKAAFQQIF